MRVSEDDIKDMEERHIMNEFARKKKLQYLVYGVVIAAVVILAVTNANKAAVSSDYGWLIIGIALIGVVFSFINWRCPSCKKYLGRRSGVKQCPSCGAKLQN